MEDKKLDVLIFMSDQHSGCDLGYLENSLVETPFLDKLEKSSYVFDNAYTSCPLCVPARTSFLTGQYASNLNVFNNANDFKTSEITLAHLFGASGYDSNLVGRMHFIGGDNYHGFNRRLGYDITSSYWGYGIPDRKDWGAFAPGFCQQKCREVIGEGDSPVMEYDRMVTKEAVDFLSKDSSKPQFTVVGTYGPHFPYVAPKELVEKYKNKLRGKVSLDKDDKLFPLSFIQENVGPDEILEIRAIYYSLVELLDGYVKQVYDAYQDYLKRNNKEGVFIYLSDHGDQVGYRNLFGKQTFFEHSSKIPLLMQFPSRKHKRIQSSVSIMDLAPTLADELGIYEFPHSDGKSFKKLFIEEDDSRVSVSEFYTQKENKIYSGYMLHKNGYKLISYYEFEDDDLLFNLNVDPDEKRNLKEIENEKYNELKSELLKVNKDQKDKIIEFKKEINKMEILNKYGKEHNVFNEFTFKCSFDNKDVDLPYK